MAAIYAGQFQAELRDLTGRALVAADGASIVVRIAGTNTAATLYNQSGTLAALAALGAAASLGNPLPAANGGGLPGIDGAGNFTFWADPSLEYDLIYTVAGATLPIAPQRVSRLVPDYRESGAVVDVLRTAEYLALVGNPDLLIYGVITRDANGAATSAPVKWPDATTGTYTATSVSSAFPGAVDAYTITYGSPVTKTYTQPTVTRNADGAVTIRPAITVA